MPLIQIAPVTRRGFFAACPLAVMRAAASPKVEPPPMPATKARLSLVFTHPGPEREGWPYLGYDYEKRKTELTARLRAACPDVEFQPVACQGAAEAQKILESTQQMDGYVVYLLGIPSDAPVAIGMSNRPTLLVDDLYGGTGTFLRAYPEARRKGMKVAGVSSSRFEDVVDAVGAFTAIKKLAASTLLDVTDRDLTQAKRTYAETLGVTLRQLSEKELHAAYEKADRAEARRWAGIWSGGAQKVLEPSPAEIEKSAAMYCGMRNLMVQNKAQGIAVDCLRLFYTNRMIAYPCLGFFQLNNDGYVGACEADIQSATSMLLMTYLTGRPGYISDPVIDTSKNQVIYAHCVASSKVYGPKGPDAPYYIRDHSEDRQGAAVRVLLPTNVMTTTVKFMPEKRAVVMHQAKAVENIDEDRACRTKLAAEVKDARKLLHDWEHGWHRVTVYGDVKTQVENVAGLMGFRVLEEG